MTNSGNTLVENMDKIPYLHEAYILVGSWGQESYCNRGQCDTVPGVGGHEHGDDGYLRYASR